MNTAMVFVECGEDTVVLEAFTYLDSVVNNNNGWILSGRHNGQDSSMALSVSARDKFISFKYLAFHLPWTLQDMNTCVNSNLKLKEPDDKAALQ